MAACPEKSRILQLGHCAVIWIASSIPEVPGIATSDMTKSGDSERAAASASSGRVKHLAEKPFIRNMAARLDAMTGSSSTMKMRGQGDTWNLFRVFLCLRVRAPRGYVETVSSSGSPAFWSILITLPGPDWIGARRPGELLRTDSTKDPWQYGRMKKKKGASKGPARATLAGIKREMQEPRLTKSVRDDPRFQVALAASFGVKEV